MFCFFMLYTKEEEFRKFILPLYLLMQLSVKAYSKYMNNKIYLHALIIRSANTKIYDLIIKSLDITPEELHDHLLNLLNHYDIWFEQFNEHEMKMKPSLSDSFIFYHLDDQSVFPKQAEQKIFDYYHQLKKEIKN
jgi:ABC-type Na+ transport system ATPase subunit NatA